MIQAAQALEVVYQQIEDGKRNEKGALLIPHRDDPEGRIIQGLLDTLTPNVVARLSPPPNQCTLLNCSGRLLKA